LAFVSVLFSFTLLNLFIHCMLFSVLLDGV